MSSVEQLLCESEQLLRELTPQVLGTVVRKFHDFAAARDASWTAYSAAAKS
jgi:predicted RNA polymerase sigma factor